MSDVTSYELTPSDMTRLRIAQMQVTRYQVAGDQTDRAKYDAKLADMRAQFDQQVLALFILKGIAVDDAANWELSPLMDNTVSIIKKV